MKLILPVFLISLLLLISSCNNKKIESCCAYPDEYERPLEIPEETPEYIYDYATRSSGRISIACQVAGFRAKQALSVSVSERLSRFDQTIDIEDQSVLRNRFSEIIESSISDTLFSTHEIKRTELSENEMKCEIVEKFDKNLYWDLLSTTLSNDSILTSINIEVYDEFVKEALRMN